MREITAILLILIAVIAIIAIIIVKLYYRDKEGNDNDTNALEDFIARNEISHESHPRRFRSNRQSTTQRQPNKRFEKYSEAQMYANTINDNNSPKSDLFNDYYNEPIKNNKRERVLANGVRIEAPRDMGRVRRGTVPANQRPVSQQRRVQSKPVANQGVKSTQEPIKREHKTTINSAKQNQTPPKARQVPMTKKQKEFISSDSKQLIVEDPHENVKVIKSIQPNTDTREKAKITPRTTQTKKQETKPKTQAKTVIESNDNYHDDLDLILRKRSQNESTLNEEPSEGLKTKETEIQEFKGSDIFKDAVSSIKNIRKNISSDNQEETYGNEDMGEDIEYNDFISITPIHEEQRAQKALDAANNQPNENIDEIYKEINNESYHKTNAEELDKSFEDVDDETCKNDANEYTEEDYKKTEDEMAEAKLREENTKKLLGLNETKEEEKPKDGILRKTAPMERKIDSVEDGQERLIVHKHTPNVEEVYMDGTLYELKKGISVIYNYNNENYESTILKIKPGHIGVKYRSKKIWVKTSAVKKVFR